MAFAQGYASGRRPLPDDPDRSRLMLHILSGHAYRSLSPPDGPSRVKSSACNQGIHYPRNSVSTCASKRVPIMFASARSQFPCAVLGVRDTTFDCDVHVHAMHQCVRWLLTGGVGSWTPPDRKFAEDRGASPGSKNSLVKNAPLALSVGDCACASVLPVCRCPRPRRGAVNLKLESHEHGTRSCR